MSVKIEIFGENATEALAELSAFAAGATGQIEKTFVTPPQEKMAEALEAIAESKSEDPKPSTMMEPEEAPQRERGKPAPGKSRRTKEEIAEDEAAETSETVVATNISTTPEDRKDPANPETVAQDVADEAEELASDELTKDDLRAVMGQYVSAYGMPATQTDGAAIFVLALGEPPAGEALWKVSLIPDDQPEMLAKAVAEWKRAVAENPFNNKKQG